MAYTTSSDPRQTVLIVSQVYNPDPAATGQYLHETAVALIQRGYRVRVVTSAQGYDDPTTQYPRHEVMDGVEVERVPLMGLAKQSLLSRMLGGSLLLAQAVARSLTYGAIDHVIVSTTPPHAGPAGALIAGAKRARLTFWAQDINPDQAVSMGHIAASAPAAQAMEQAVRLTLRAAHRVVALDRFMAERLIAKVDVAHKTTVIPPWPLQGVAMQAIGPVSDDNAFRCKHALQGKLVVMYSGNISPTHPVDSLLKAATLLTDRPDIQFLFVGGGHGKAQVEAFAAAHPSAHIRTLPYQPLQELPTSLSAANIHVVTMGDNQVGIVHPSKVYSALAVGRPILYVGPQASHVGDIVERFGAGFSFRHGQAEEIAATLRSVADGPLQPLQAMGQKAQNAAQTEFSRQTLLEKLLDAIIS